MRARAFLASLAFLTLLAARPPLAAAAVPHITEHVIRAELEPGASTIRVTDRISVVEIETSVFRFLLNENLKIDRIALGERELQWRRSENDPSFWEVAEGSEGETWENARVVEVNVPRSGGGTADLTVVYSGRILDSLQAPGDAYARSFATTSGIIETRGAFLGGSTVWLPTVPGDRFTFRLETTVPRGWETVSQGKLDGRFERGSRLVSRWSSDVPMEEAYLVAGPYHLRESDFENIKIQTFLYDAEDAERLHQTYTAATRNYLERYSRQYGPYAYPKFALVENFWQTGYGMPSFTLLGDRVIRLPHIPFTSYGHEILHNWWGNGVWVDWEKGNWCEGLTAYGADYAYQEDKGPEEAAAYRRGELQKFQDYVSGAEDFPLVDFRGRHNASTQAVGYSKATMVFHMLRKEIGDEAFRTGLRRFYAERKFLFSDWGHLRAAFEAASGEDLEGFFRQWTTRTGAPSLRMEKVKAGSAGDDRFEVKGRLVQEGTPWRIDVPVVIETDAGQDTVIVYLEDREKSFEWKGRGRPAVVAVDPGFDIFRRLHREEIPPALSGTLGGDSTLIVLPAEGGSESGEALEDLARGWAERSGARIVRGEAPADLLARRTVWLLGETAYTDRFLGGLPEGCAVSADSIVLPGGRFGREGRGFVLTLVHPENRDLTWSLFLPGDAGSIQAVGRKTPHYGRYGYLVFEGETNVGKGEWPSGVSPLRQRLAVGR
ncbi:MAG: hypothetical protein JW958_09945 [Candidatus Eisenbacteria bacterium]|nr:hypothetical protein [Candidatus Eisenbacteria bacterium]